MTGAGCSIPLGRAARASRSGGKILFAEIAAYRQNRLLRQTPVKKGIWKNFPMPAKMPKIHSCPMPSRDAIPSRDLIIQAASSGDNTPLGDYSPDI